MPLPKRIQKEVLQYCEKHLADENWYNDAFDFIEDTNLRSRIITEFQGTRFAYKLFEGIEAKEENLVFEIRHQILSYASIYEAIIHYVLYCYYQDTEAFHNLQYHLAPARLAIPSSQKEKLSNELTHCGEEIIPYHIKERKKDEAQIRFDDKCKAAEKLGLISTFINNKNEKIDLPAELIEIYGYRNAIHLMAEQRKGIQYELDLSKKAYRRMRPFIDQIKAGLKRDHKSIYAAY